MKNSVNGIIVINKEKDYTSRDVVNKLCKIFSMKKIGHTGTLDPLAEGVLVVCLGNALKISELITAYDKEYIAKVKLGIETDTLDITGKVLKENNVLVSKEQLEKVLNSFLGEIEQEVPIYSAVKVNGKKLYEYARKNIEVDLPKHKVNIYNIELLQFNNNEFTIKVRVSKGTYIRSLVRDIGYKLSTYATLTELTRIKQGNFKIEESYRLSDIELGNYQLLRIKDILDIEKITLNDDMLFRIKNGQVLDSFFSSESALLLDKYGNEVAIYKKIDNNKVKPWKMF